MKQRNWQVDVKEGKRSETGRTKGGNAEELLRSDSSVFRGENTSILY